MIDLPKGNHLAYIFDCDGTLADSMPAHYRAWKHAFESHGAVFDFTWELFYQQAGVGMHDSVINLNQQFNDTLEPDAVIETYNDKMLEEHDTVGPIEPVLLLARRLAQKYPVAVASGGSREHVTKTLRLIDALELFPVIITKEDVVNSKPAPDTFLLAAEKLGVEPERCLVFEDSQLGLEAARRAGMDSVFIDPEEHSSLRKTQSPE